MNSPGVPRSANCRPETGQQRILLGGEARQLRHHPLRTSPRRQRDWPSMKEFSRRVQRIRGRDCISPTGGSVVSVQSDNPAPTYAERPIGIDATGTRTEFDSLGTVEVPADRYWGRADAAVVAVLLHRIGLRQSHCRTIRLNRQAHQHGRRRNRRRVTIPDTTDWTKSSPCRAEHGAHDRRMIEETSQCQPLRSI
jgi:hypothetical protein